MADNKLTKPKVVKIHSEDLELYMDQHCNRLLNTTFGICFRNEDLKDKKTLKNSLGILIEDIDKIDI